MGKPVPEINVVYPDHAVKVLKSLIEKLDGKWAPSNGYTHLVIGMVEGAKAVIFPWEKYRYENKNGSWGNGYRLGLEDAIVKLARAYAPMMIEAGIEVPSA